MPTELNVYTPNNTCSIDRLSISFQKSLKSVSSFDFWKSNSVTTSMVKKKNTIKITRPQTIILAITYLLDNSLHILQIKIFPLSDINQITF